MGKLLDNILYFIKTNSDAGIRMLLFFVMAVLLYMILQRLLMPNLTKRVVRTLRKMRIEDLNQQQEIAREISESQAEANVIDLSEKRWLRYLQKLLYSTNPKKYDANSVQKFFAISATLSLTAYIGLGIWMKLFPQKVDSVGDVFRFLNFWLLVGSMAIGSVWFFIKSIQLRFLRVDKADALYDAVELFQLKYRSENKNIYFALKSLVQSLQTDIKFSFGHILNGIQTRNDKYVQNAIEMFIFDINKSWAKQIAILINRALDGQDIDLSLARVLSDMSEVNKELYLLYNNSADARYLGYAPLIIMPIVLYFNQKESGGESWRLLFEYNSGKLIFLACLVICVINLLVALFLRKPNHDV